jgi:hypothetical protein
MVDEPSPIAHVWLYGKHPATHAHRTRSVKAKTPDVRPDVHKSSIRGKVFKDFADTVPFEGSMNIQLSSYGI